jgi:hypothetical protein
MSGANDYHGALFEFLRNATLDAKNYYDFGSKPIPPFKRNQFGGTLGGPVMVPKILNGKDKLFFFFDYQGLRERKARWKRTDCIAKSDVTHGRHSVEQSCEHRLVSRRKQHSLFHFNKSKLRNGSLAAPAHGR